MTQNTSLKYHNKRQDTMLENMSPVRPAAEQKGGDLSTFAFISSNVPSIAKGPVFG